MKGDLERAGEEPRGWQHAFDDSTGEASGTWVTGRPPAAKPGFLFYIMVNSVAAAIDAVVANGGEIVQPIGGTRL